MRDLAGKVAVVTGGASGIGHALASRFATEGMKLVLVDVEAAPLAEVTQAFEAQGVEVLARCTCFATTLAWARGGPCGS
jgi:NAD(P)-dependent dehydrogenase (short-subunit alcohol dehydrogenase family)